MFIIAILLVSVNPKYTRDAKTCMQAKYTHTHKIKYIQKNFKTHERIDLSSLPRIA